VLVVGLMPSRSEHKYVLGSPSGAPPSPVGNTCCPRAASLRGITRTTPMCGRQGWRPFGRTAPSATEVALCSWRRAGRIGRFCRRPSLVVAQCFLREGEAVRRTTCWTAGCRSFPALLASCRSPRSRLRLDEAHIVPGVACVHLRVLCVAAVGALLAMSAPAVGAGRTKDCGTVTYARSAGQGGAGLSYLTASGASCATARGVANYFLRHSKAPRGWHETMQHKSSTKGVRTTFTRRAARVVGYFNSSP
jgi:hypothetical protein